MRPLSEKIAGVTESATIAISNKAKGMQREGIDVISLSIGEPDFATPQHITDACIDALRRGETHYAPSNGIPELTTAISKKIARENGFPCTPQQVIVACGAKDAIYEAMEAVLNPGDETIILTPAWVSYEPCVHIAGGKIVKHAINPRTFQLDDSLLERVSAKTKMIVVNSPSNPTGAVFDRKSMKLVADLHIHSHYSRATSKNLTPEGIARWAQIKGIQVVANPTTAIYPAGLVMGILTGTEGTKISVATSSAATNRRRAQPPAEGLRLAGARRVAEG